MADRINIRIDDVLTESKQWAGKRGPKERFLQMSRWVHQAGNKVQYTPTILVEDIAKYSEVIEYIKHSTAEGKMAPALHGYQHIDYGSLPDQIVKDHLSKSLDWFHDYLWYTPSVWATPWGAYTNRLKDLAWEFSLKLEGVQGLHSPGSWLDVARKEGFCSSPVFDHWWVRGQKLLRVVEVIKAGSYDIAKENRPDIF